MTLICETEVPTNYSPRPPSSGLALGQHVAVVAGEGQGWMARVVKLDNVMAETMYWVELADGRQLAKLDAELEPLRIDGWKL